MKLSEVRVKERSGYERLTRAITIPDLLSLAREGLQDWERKEFLIDILALDKDFANVIAEIVVGEHEEGQKIKSGDQIGDYNFDVVREALVENADEAVQLLLKRMLSEIFRLQEVISEKDKENTELRKQWPSGFEKYIPKEASKIFSGPSVSQEAIEALVENTKEKGISFLTS